MRCTVRSNRPSVDPLPQCLTKRHFIEKIPARNDVWCVKDGGKGRTLRIGVPTAKLDCVWIPASKFFTLWITSKFQPMKTVRVCVCFNNHNRKFYKIWFSSFFSKLNFMKS
jgi:hypothetical protein